MSEPEYLIGYYMLYMFSSGIDKYERIDGLDNAIRTARRTLKAGTFTRSHAVISGPYGKLAAVVSYSKGRWIAKRAL